MNLCSSNPPGLGYTVSGAGASVSPFARQSYKTILFLFWGAVLGFSCSLQDLQSSLWHSGCFSCGIWNLVPWPGIKPGLPALGVQNLSLWATRKVLSYSFLLYLKFHLWDSIHYWCTDAEPLASESPTIPILGLSRDLFSLMLPSVVRTKMLSYFTSGDEKWINNQSRKKQIFIRANLRVISWETVFQKVLSTVLPVSSQITIIYIFEIKGCCTSNDILMVYTIQIHMYNANNVTSTP